MAEVTIDAKELVDELREKLAELAYERTVDGLVVKKLHALANERQEQINELTQQVLALQQKLAEVHNE